MKALRIRSKSEEETVRLGARLAGRARGGELLCLDGPLGAGKTTFVRGFLRGLGHRGVVPSPTFALVNEYARVRPRVYHIDLYRIDEEGLGTLDLEEYFGDRGAACLIEWPEAAGSRLAEDRVTVRFRHAGERERELSLSSGGERSERLLAGLRGKG